MRVYSGGMYRTQRGRIVGPLQCLGNRFTYNEGLETGIWDRNGDCAHPESATGWSFGGLTHEIKQETDE